MIASLAERGHDIHVVYRGQGSVPGATYESYAIPEFCLKYPWRWEKRKYKYLSGFLNNYDVISVQFLHNWEFTPEIMEEGCFTVQPWGSDICPPPGGVQPGEGTIECRKTMLCCAHAVAVTCDTFRHTVAEYAGIDPSRIERTPLGVDLDEFRPFEQRSERPTIGFYKGFGYAYGAINLVRAMPRISRVYPNVIFDMVGSGPTLDPCKAEAESLGMNSKIRWLDKVPHQEVPRMIGSWWLSVIPSICESFGIAALESSAMEIPVVASAVGGLCETVDDGRTGTLVPPADSEVIADAVIDLLGDREKRIAYGTAGRQFVQERYQWRDCVTSWEKFHEDAIASRVSCGVSP